MSVGIFVPGMTGRMGHLIAQQAYAHDGFTLLGATVRKGTLGENEDAGPLLGHGHVELRVKSELNAAVNQSAEAGRRHAVIVDFTSPAALLAHIEAARRHHLALLVGTTGLSADEERALDTLAQDVPVMLAANTSLGANLLAHLSAQAARALPTADAEVVELHHRHKKDSPSGTALMVGRAIAAARQQSDDAFTTARSGMAPRVDDEIGIFGVRGGDVVGEHTAYFFLEGERIEVTHRVSDRRIFARGALVAARFLSEALAAGRRGRFTMNDVLGLDEPAQ